ncbi:uncharacterized protein LOC112099565 [Citrus clementina]|uniref:uncharacterized protein LOC112099565 n=1 Tax=Citrus clementina TaxID=85681 RepID=UPI000CED31D1|nr:uncharacterized protein LOC112099565 [Citrus x clementina]
MDKSWISLDRRSEEYRVGVKRFLNFAVRHTTNPNHMRCPCLKCGNVKYQNISEIETHLIIFGIDQSYTNWFLHGEELVRGPSTSRNAQLIREVDYDHVDNTIELVQGAHDNFESNPDAFQKLLEDAEKPLYPGCSNFKKLSALVKLYNLKVKSGWSDKSFSELLKLLGEMLPDQNEIPTSMWKVIKNSEKLKSGLPAKVLWYVPPIPRFTRMFSIKETSKNLTWHAEQREVDGYLRHPADTPSWKLIDYTWPAFASEPRNLRLALSTDGINPHSSLSSRYSCWPVILVTYNLPPWLCMKRKFMMLTLLISGPKQPGNDIDVYLAPLIDDLRLLWEVGVDVYDAYRQQSFNLKAILLWTISDFPAYGNLAGCTVKGYKACPICGEKTRSIQLQHSKKISFMRHRRFLSRSHPYRDMVKEFNGLPEYKIAPETLNGEEVLAKVDRLNVTWGKRNGKCPVSQSYWKKNSIFFDLEYWKYLYVRHVLDVMYIEKNVCESIVGTLLGIEGKTKDGLAARMDLKPLNMRTELEPITENGRTKLPSASFTLSKEEKIRFCKTLSEIKAPDGYSSNIRNRVSMQDLKLYGMKSHDCHVLKQHKVVNVAALDQLQADVVETVCSLEMYFLPAFFDVMVYLMVHLVREVKLCGPIYLRWMYPFERDMKKLKGYVRNRNRPEGCIAEAYIAEEAVEFCSEYLSGVDAVGLPSRKNATYDYSDMGYPLLGGKLETVPFHQWQQAHLYVLANTNDVQPYIDEHFEYLKELHPIKSKREKWLHDEHSKTFIGWLRLKVEQQLNSSSHGISESLRWIAQGPRLEVIKYSRYVINDCRFYTKELDDARVVQNSGITLMAKALQISSAKDNNPVYSDMTFYGIIEEIWELDYHQFRIPVFRCDWVKSSNGIKVDKFGFTLVDLQRTGHKNDPFILASQAKQVFYVEDQLDPRWSIVLEPSINIAKDDVDEDGLYDHFMNQQALSSRLPLI